MSLRAVRPMTILPPSAFDDAVASFRKLVVDLEQENRDLRRVNARLAHENGDLCDRVFELEKRMGIPAFPGCKISETSEKATMPEGLGKKEKQA